MNRPPQHLDPDAALIQAARHGAHMQNLLDGIGLASDREALLAAHGEQLASAVDRLVACAAGGLTPTREGAEAARRLAETVRDTGRAELARVIRGHRG